MNEIADQFGDDLEIVKAKYLVLLANTNFILGNKQACLDAAKLGLVAVDLAKSSDEAIMRAMSHTKQDLNNLVIRCTAALSKQNAWTLRSDLKKAEDAKLVPKEADESDEEVEESHSITKGLALMSLVSASVGAVAYLALKKQ